VQAVHACTSLGTEEQLVLPGYGVEAVLKNMEYSAMDEKSKKDAAAAAAAKKKKLAGNAAGDDGGDALAGIDVAELGEVKGFKFDVLVRRKPQLVQELMTFRDVLLSSDEEESIKVRIRTACQLWLVCLRMRCCGCCRWWEALLSQ
jgi:UDP-glucose:glycoprotein glucosyltransferase